jgi:hypothetical protein
VNQFMAKVGFAANGEHQVFSLADVIAEFGAASVECRFGEQPETGHWRRPVMAGCGP